jgi:hypothetical protein
VAELKEKELSPDSDFDSKMIQEDINGYPPIPLDKNGSVAGGGYAKL